MKETYQGLEIKGNIYFTVWQIAMMLRISFEAVENFIKIGELESKNLNNVTLITEANLEAFLETHSFPARWIGGDGFF